MPFSLHVLCFYISFPPNSPAPATYPLFLLHTYTYCDSHLLTLIIFSVSSDLDCIISYLIISSHLQHFFSLLFFSCIYNVIYLLNFSVNSLSPPPCPNSPCISNLMRSQHTIRSCQHVGLNYLQKKKKKCSIMKLCSSLVTVAFFLFLFVSSLFYCQSIT